MIEAGTRWRDERGNVSVRWCDDERVGYERDGRHFMLTVRRFLRDFKHDPSTSVSRRER